MRNISFPFLSLAIISSFIPRWSFGECGYTGSFQTKWGNTEKYASVAQVTVPKYPDSATTQNSSLGTGIQQVKTNEGFAIFEFSDFNPAIAGLGPLTSIFSANKIDIQSKKWGTELRGSEAISNSTQPCLVTLVIGSMEDKNFTEEVEAMTSWNAGSGPNQSHKDGKTTTLVPPEFKIHTIQTPAFKKYDVGDGKYPFNHIYDEKIRSFDGFYRPPFFIKSIKAKCTKPILYGAELRVCAYSESVTREELDKKKANPTGDSSSDDPAKAESAK